MTQNPEATEEKNDKYNHINIRNFSLVKISIKTNDKNFKRVFASFITKSTSLIYKMLLEIHEKKRCRKNRKGSYNHVKSAQLLLIIEMYIKTTFRHHLPPTCSVNSKNVVTWSTAKNVVKQAPSPTDDGGVQCQSKLQIHILSDLTIP